VLPLLKHKHGDATDINMYRGITISPVISKVFKLILLKLYESFLIVCHYSTVLRKAIAAIMLFLLLMSQSTTSPTEGLECTVRS